MNIFEKLNAIQCDLKAPKSQYNSFGKYNYRNCEDILEAVKPLCAKNKTSLTLTDEIVLIGDRYYVKATATLYDQESEEVVNTSAFAREEENKKGMDGSQVTGASSSYARKYALNGLFNIDDTKDSDTTNTHGQGDNKPQETPQQLMKKYATIIAQHSDLTAEQIIAQTQQHIANQYAEKNKPITQSQLDELTAKKLLSKVQQNG